MFKFWLYLSVLNLIAFGVYILRVCALFGYRFKDNKNKNKNKLKSVYSNVQTLFLCLFPFVHLISLLVVVYLIFCDEKELEKLFTKQLTK